MIPKYIEIKKKLLIEIHDGLFKPGNKFYSESEAIKKFNVSSITVRRAFKELTSEGHIYAIKGKGRFISHGKLKQTVQFTDVEKYPEHKTEVEVLSIKSVENKKIQKILQVDDNKKIFQFERLRKSNGEPFFVQYSYIPSDYINEADIKYPKKFESIYSKMKQDFNFNLALSPSEEYYRIAFPTPHSIATLLDIEENSPTSFAVRTTYLEDGSVFEYIESYKRWDYYCSKIEAL